MLYRCIGTVIHQPLSSDVVCPHISSSLRLLVLCLVRLACFSCIYVSELQIYNLPTSLKQDLKKWGTTFQGNAPVGRILFGCK